MDDIALMTGEGIPRPDQRSTEWLDRFNRVLAAIAERVALIAVASVMLIAFVNVLDVVLRNFFSLSLYGRNEINALLVAIAVSTCLPVGLARGSVLRIEILESRVSYRARLWLTAFGTTCISIFFALLAYRIWMNAHLMAVTQQTTVMTNTPKAPFFYGVAIALALAAIVQALITAKDIFVAVRQSPGWGVPLVSGVGLVMSYVTLAMFGVVPGGFFMVLAPSSPLLLSGWAFLLMWVVIMLTTPIGVAMGLTGLVGTAALIGIDPALNVLGAESTTYITRDALSVLPLFLLMGAFASVAGVGSDLYRVAYALVGHLRGGLAHASIMACAGFGTLTGSSVATQMSIGRIALKEMQDRGYSAEISAGSIAAGGTLGQLIPPSSALILYAVMTEQSVGELFIGALIPGILATLLYMATVTVWLWLWPHHATKGPKSSFRDIAEVSIGAWSVLLLLGVVLGGIYGGFFTELEAGSVGAVGAFLLSIARGKLNAKTFWKTMAETTGSLAMMYTLIFGTVMLTFFFGIAGLPQAFIAFMNSFDLSPLAIIICLVLCYLILGTAMDSFAMMVITIPIFTPLVHSLGYDPVWWGIMTLICMEAGQISPPFGLNMFVISALDDKIPMSKVFKGSWPFFGSTLVKIALLIAFPALATWLPGTMRPG